MSTKPSSRQDQAHYSIGARVQTQVHQTSLGAMQDQAHYRRLDRAHWAHSLHTHPSLFLSGQSPKSSTLSG